MIGPKGHFLNNLIDTTMFFKKKLKIYWVLNKNFNDEGTYIPNEARIFKIITTNTFKRKNNKILYISFEIYFFLLNLFNIFFFGLYFLKKKNFFNYFFALKSNYFILPKYFRSFYKKYKRLNLNRNDHIFFPTARRKDMSLINFLIKIDKKHPKFHIRVMLPPNDKFKDFFYYLKQIQKQLNNKTAFVYLWSDYNYRLFLKKIQNKNGIFKSNIPWSFYKRKFKKNNHVIGYMGDARPSRGFQYMPKIINILERKKNNFKYLIQFSKISKDLIGIKNKLYTLSKTNRRITIVERYLDYQEYLNLLKKIDIMPILHNSKEINHVTSGTMYSCVPYQTAMVIPKNTNFMNDILKHKSYEEAKNINDFVNKIIKISKNYKYYHKNVKKNSLILKKILKNDALKKNII